MNADAALALILELLKTTAEITAPVLLASLVAGVLIGIVQTATQVNESSISFAAKVAAVVVILLVAGPLMADKMIAYTKASLNGVATVVTQR